MHPGTDDDTSTPRSASTSPAECVNASDAPQNTAESLKPANGVPAPRLNGDGAAAAAATVAAATAAAAAAATVAAAAP